MIELRTTTRSLLLPPAGGGREEEEKGGLDGSVPIGPFRIWIDKQPSSRDWKGTMDIVLFRAHVSDPLNGRKRTEWERNDTRV